MRSNKPDAGESIIKVVAGPAAIAKAFEGFKPEYVQGYFDVHCAATTLLFLPADSPIANVEQSTRALATVLIRVLKEWGANKRVSPRLRPEAEIVKLFTDPRLREMLRDLSELRTRLPSVYEGKRVVGTGSHSPDQLDAIVIAVLNQLACGLFERCTNLTYPSKAVLLLTGYMVAVDSEVRSGAQYAGFTGMGSLLAVADTRHPDLSTAKKITAMPYLLGQAWPRIGDQIKAALVVTGRKDLLELLGHPARIFDILLFMQSQSKRMRKYGQRAQLLRLDNSFHPHAWYRIS